MKKLLILTCALCTLSSYAANAQINVILGVQDPVYVERPYYPSEHYNRQHSYNDYWQRKQQEENERQARIERERQVQEARERKEQEERERNARKHHAKPKHDNGHNDHDHH